MGKLNWIKLKQDYGFRHISPDSSGSIEQFTNGKRKGLVEMWGQEEVLARTPVTFDDLRSAKRAFREKYAP
jgi:hypothetical protein